jgi:hypothetical protein
MLVNTRDFTYAEKIGTTIMYLLAGRIGFSGEVPYGMYVVFMRLT